MVYGLSVLEDKEAPLSCSWPIATELKKLPLPKKKGKKRQLTRNQSHKAKRRRNKREMSRTRAQAQAHSYQPTMAPSVVLVPCCVKKTKAE